MVASLNAGKSSATDGLRAIMHEKVQHPPGEKGGEEEGQPPCLAFLPALLGDPVQARCAGELILTAEGRGAQD